MTFIYSSRMHTNHPHTCHRSTVTALTPHNVISVLPFPSLCLITIAPPNYITLKLFGARTIFPYVCLSPITAGCWFKTGVSVWQCYKTCSNSEQYCNVQGQNSKSDMFISPYYQRELRGSFRKEFFLFCWLDVTQLKKYFVSKRPKALCKLKIQFYKGSPNPQLKPSQPLREIWQSFYEADIYSNKCTRH